MKRRIWNERDRWFMIVVSPPSSIIVRTWEEMIIIVIIYLERYLIVSIDSLLLLLLLLHLFVQTHHWCKRFLSSSIFPISIQSNPMPFFSSFLLSFSLTFSSSPSSSSHIDNRLQHEISVVLDRQFLCSSNDNTPISFDVVLLDVWTSNLTRSND